MADRTDTPDPETVLPVALRGTPYAQDLLSRIQSLPDSQQYSLDSLDGRPEVSNAIRAAMAAAQARETEILLHTQHLQEAREHTVNVLTHELRVPAVAIRACCDRIRRECEKQGVSFTHDYLGDLESYCELLTRLLREVDILRRGPQRIQLNPHRVPLLKTVIAPAIRFVTPLLKRRGFSERRIRYSSFQELPLLYVDTSLMTQVVFNLLDNAIKYAYSDPDAFSVELKASVKQNTFDIMVSDFGVGIEAPIGDSVFAEGFRGTSATRMNTTGSGLGLTVARGLVQRHGGDLSLTNPRMPTTFTVSLPKRLAFTAPE
jgi:signal transduction histidine kinase